MFRIANVCLSRSWGGLEMSALEMARSLADRGHRVHSIAVEGSRLSDETHRAGLAQITVPQVWKYFDPRALRRIRTSLRRHRIDIVQAHHSKDIWNIYPALLGLSEIKLYYLSAMLFKGAVKRDLLHSMLYRRLTGVMVLTEIGKRHFVSGTRVPADRIRVIPYGFRPADFDLPPGERVEVRRELGLGADEVAIGCIGRIDRQKGQYELLEAVRTVLRKHTGIRLLLAGEPTYGEGEAFLDFLKSKSRQHGMDRHVIFAGFRADVARVLSALDIFVLPSYEETFGKVTVEAMLSGLACIGTDAGGTPELLDRGQCGLLVEPRSARGLARALQTLVESPELRRDLGERARRSARERFDVGKVMGLVEDFYGSP
jgi:glycosyltransferase involved in cell wall biosynthesis